MAILNLLVLIFPLLFRCKRDGTGTAELFPPFDRFFVYLKRSIVYRRNEGGRTIYGSSAFISFSLSLSLCPPWPLPNFLLVSITVSPNEPIWKSIFVKSVISFFHSLSMKFVVLRADIESLKRSYLHSHELTLFCPVHFVPLIHLFHYCRPHQHRASTGDFTGDHSPGDTARPRKNFSNEQPKNLILRSTRRKTLDRPDHCLHKSEQTAQLLYEQRRRP